MKILLVGSGGREHALAWRLAASKKCKELYCAPGNPGIGQVAQNVLISADDVPALSAFAREKKIDFVVVGPEAPLVAGLADALAAAGIAVFGPSKAAARLEGSKGFTKDLCSKYGIPTASYGRFTDAEAACAFIRQTGAPIVVKADGLAAGKGVIIAQTVEEAEEAALSMLSGAAFGAAGAEIVVEEYLDGEEISFFALTDGKTALPFASAQDHKRAGEGDTGPNTGGMGAYSPAHNFTPELQQKIMDRIIHPTVKGMAAEGCPFQGVLYAGLMIVRGEPMLIEYNVRFGDPECQPILSRLEDDLLDILYACAAGTLDEIPPLHWSDYAALCVVMAAKGYPGGYDKGSVIRGIKEADAIYGVKVFHAGTAFETGNIVSYGGRVLGVTASAPTIAEAQKLAYEGVDLIDWPEGFCRRDIGWRAIRAEGPAGGDGGGGGGGAAAAKAEAR
ncbi:MAG: phosphoribosylamine--glycine ligase [Micavibrio sp.]